MLHFRFETALASLQPPAGRDASWRATRNTDMPGSYVRRMSAASYSGIDSSPAHSSAANPPKPIRPKRGLRPHASHERPRREPSDPARVANHVRLVRVARCGSDVRPIDVVLLVPMRECFKEGTLSAAKSEKLSVGQSQPLLEATLQLARAASCGAPRERDGAACSP